MHRAATTVVFMGKWPVMSELLLLCCLALLVCAGASSVRAQTGNATIAGQITDAQEKIVPGVEVQVVNMDTNAVYPGKTNNSGIYSVSGLPPGTYRMVVRKDGFKEINNINLVLHTQDTLEQNFALQVGSVSESVTVSATTTNESPAVSMTVTREFVENMPLNGRSFQDLIQLAPGTVAASNTGYYSINGQRTDSNNYTVDGVSANLGGINNNSSGGLAAQALAGTSGSQTVLGTTQSLASIDSLQEFTIQTSGYAAEYGRNPGGQIAFTTRSGANDIHGTLFDYLRNTVFDANSYQQDYYGLPKSPEHQNDFGGTIGGPLIIPRVYNGKDKTFYFFSYEGLRQLLPTFESEYVPTQAFRNWASPLVQPYLNIAPLPNPNSPGNQDGCTIPDPATGLPTACDAIFARGYSTPNNVDNISLRVDQDFSERIHGFFRYADTPSSGTSGLQDVSIFSINSHSWTAGLTADISHTLLDDFRFNYSCDGEASTAAMKAVNGSVPLPRSLVIPSGYDSPYSYASIGIVVPGSSLRATGFFGGTNSTQHQLQFVDSLAWTRAKHSLKFGVDFRQLTPTYVSQPYNSNIDFLSLAALQQGYSTLLFVGAVAPGKPVFHNVSLYAQDHWKINSKLTIDYGLRWEFNPPPGPSNGQYPVALTSSNLATAQLAPLGTAPYKSQYDKFAPRFGFAWNAIPSTGHPLTVRGGFGIFYDTGQQVIGLAYANNYPFATYGPLLFNEPLPFSAAVLTPPPPSSSLTPPYPLTPLSSPHLTLPYTEQWNLSLDERLNARNTFTVSYVGNVGRKLLFTQYYEDIPANPDFANGLYFTSNASQSSYNALQIQDSGRIANGLNLVGSFTWAHALDNASNTFSEYSPIWGNSDNDLPRVFNLALTYETSSAGGSRWMHAVTHGWLIANRFSAQSGYPINLVQDYDYLPNGTAVEYNPDLVPGVPIYLHGSAADLNGQPVPGSWRLNSAAFAPVPTDPITGLPIRQGTLPRNYVRNPGFWTLNSAVQRTFPVHEQLHLIFRLEAFNIFNHPNLANPDPSLSDSTFGQLVNGTVATIGSINPLYSMGSARSLQFSLKLQF